MPIRSMMAKFNVSQSAIERCLDELVREGLVTRRRGSGIYTNSLPSGNKVIGVYTDSEVAPHSHMLFLEGVRQAAEEHGLQAADFGPRDIFDEQEEVLKTMQKMGFAGIVAEVSTATYFHLEDEKLQQRFRELKIPIVSCLPLPGMEADSVMPDHFSAYRKVGVYFRGKGSLAIKFLGYNGIPSLARLQGLQVGLGKNRQLEIETLEKSQTTVFQRIRELLDGGWKGNLVVGVPPDYPSDLEVLRNGPWHAQSPYELTLLLESGERPPEGIAAHIVKKQTKLHGKTAVEQLLRRIRGYRGDIQHRIIPHLVTFHQRPSYAPTPGAVLAP